MQKVYIMRAVLNWNYAALPKSRRLPLSTHFEKRNEVKLQLKNFEVSFFFWLSVSGKGRILACDGAVTVGCLLLWCCLIRSPWWIFSLVGSGFRGGPSLFAFLGKQAHWCNPIFLCPVWWCHGAPQLEEASHFPLKLSNAIGTDFYCHYFSIMYFPTKATRIPKRYSSFWRWCVCVCLSSWWTTLWQLCHQLSAHKYSHMCTKTYSVYEHDEIAAQQQCGCDVCIMSSSSFNLLPAAQMEGTDVDSAAERQEKKITIS